MAHRTLDEIVREFMIQRGDETIGKHYPRLLQIAIRGAKYMNKRQKDNYKVLRVDAADMTYNDTISLPNDYIKYRQIAVCIDGKIIGLGRNNNLCPPSVDDCGDPVVTSAYGNSTSDGGTLYNFTVDTQSVQDRDFGHGGGYNSVGYYHIYENDGYIAVSLNRDFDELIIEYLADLSANVDGNYTVHPFDEEALLDYIYWQSMARLRTYGAGEKREAEIAFKRSMIEAYKMKTRFNPRELVSAVRSGFMSGPKI